MDLPSSRDLELESLLRERDTQVLQLTDEVTRSRQNSFTQPTLSTSDPVSLPPTLVSLLLPHLILPSSSVPHASHTVIAALNQRVGMLQEENDELYELLKKGEVGKLKEEVRGLRHAVEKLGSALRESHQVILSMSAELDKTYEALTASSRQANLVNNVKAQSQSPRNSYLPSPQHNVPGNGHITSKPPPTGPRSQKKQRISDANAAPPQPRFSGPNLGHRSHSHARSNQGFPRNSDSREFRSSEHRSSTERKPNHVKMEIDQDQGARRPSPSTERSRDRDREHEHEWSVKDRERTQRDRDRDRERPRERERDVNRASNPRRNGNSGQSTVPHRGRGGSQGPTVNPARRTDRDRSANGSITDRTLAERMGL
ncbi:hypothetical protein BDQ17DRAFT_1349265 [Cyathus striatus]|nr:hypothetical protein BDQ17DRAFT_1349265 [Cyathus striatus]